MSEIINNSGEKNSTQVLMARKYSESALKVAAGARTQIQSIVGAFEEDVGSSMAILGGMGLGDEELEHVTAHQMVRKWYNEEPHGCLVSGRIVARELTQYCLRPKIKNHDTKRTTKFDMLPKSRWAIADANIIHPPRPIELWQILSKVTPGTTSDAAENDSPWAFAMPFNMNIPSK